MSSPPSKKSSPNAARVLGEALICLVCASAISAAFVWFCYHRGYTLYYGDAAAHLNIARRIVDSRHPGYDQIGTVWLPLPHALMLPLVRNNRLWRSGLAGTIPAAAFFVLGAAFLYGAVRRATASLAAAITAAAIYALNPNLLYLQATPMTEPIFAGCFAMAVFFAVSFQEVPRFWHVLGAALAVFAATLTRYDGWFLIPFFALFFLLRGSMRSALLFTLLASLGPLYWLAHNRVIFGDALEFYRSPGSTQGIYARALASGMARYPGDHDFRTAWIYYRKALELAIGLPLLWTAAAGGVVALLRKTTRPLILLGLPLPFYLLSLHSGGTPIFIPKLWPFSYYNTRYALAMLPACAAAAGVLVAVLPKSFLRGAGAMVLLAVGLGGWILHPGVESWICWKESEVNSRGRRQWTREAADFLRDRYRSGDGILTVSGDVMDIYREAGIPLRETLNDGSFLQWFPAVNRPDLFLHEKWVVAIAGDPISFNLTNPRRFASVCERVATFTAEREPVIDVYRRVSGAPAKNGASTEPRP